MARILVAEDDSDVRNLIALVLIEAGHEVRAVDNGDVALDRIIYDPPEILILDIMMPVTDGYGVLEDLQRSGIGAVVKVLVLSARSTEQDFEKSFELGACDFMSKPFDPAELVTRIERLMGLSKEDIQKQREEERDRARLLLQLESVLGTD